MKTQQQAQEIFNVLVTELKSANDWNLFYVTRNLNNRRPGFTIDTPLEYFLKSTRKKLTEEDVSEEFLSRVYAEAFHTGPIPRNRNHIAMTCGLQTNSRPPSPVLRFWIDLDKVATQLNTHLRINPPYRFEVKYHATPPSWGMSFDSGGPQLLESTSSAVNSIPSSINTNFLLGFIVSGVVSCCALLIAALAVASIISLSTAGIFTAVGVGLVAGVASYCFFKARYSVNTTVAPIEESNSENIEDIFRNHFAATIGAAVSEDILPQVPVDIIDEHALSI